MKNIKQKMISDKNNNTFLVKKPVKKYFILPLKNIFISILIVLFFLNQLMIVRVSAMMGMDSAMASALGMRGKTSKMIIAPKVNTDGKTTSLFEWPTITDIAANPHSGNALADARIVMTAVGKPFYAPNDVSFDDPINAQKKWGVYETSIKLTAEQEQRYQKLIAFLMTCSYCCGEPNNVTMNKNCGCAHAKAVRGFYRFMIQNYDNKYSDEEFVGESHRWYALWYPKGMLEDYLLATGNQNALSHESHGGVGSDGKHGLK